MVPPPQIHSWAEALRAARDTRALVIGEQVLSHTPNVFREQFGDQPAQIVADANTFAAAGQVVQNAFHAARHRVLEPLVFRQTNLSAEYSLVLELESHLRVTEVIPVAVGSGTINDMTKLAAHQVGRPYLCVATAASMDGYAAFGASITREGSKQTFPCPAPAAIVADLDVLRAAPVEMNAWGYADLLAKVPAGADWMLADALDVEAIHPLAWNLVQGRLREAVADPAGVRARQPRALGRLIEGLMLSGFAMQAMQASRPASGAEHQFSHLWDMQHHTYQGQAPSHGLKVGIGTLAITALDEALLELPMDQLDVEACCASWKDESAWIQCAQARFDEGELMAVARREYPPKHCNPNELRRQLERLRIVWPQLAEQLRRQLMPLSLLQDRLRLVGAATEPEQIGITRHRLRDSYWQAFFTRRRFTVLDLAVRTGTFDQCLERIFGPDGLWPVNP